jgi:hypothetical protein
VLDPAIVLVGLQAVPDIPEVSALVFLHEGCGSISVRTSLLRHALEASGADVPAADPGTGPCDGCYRDLDDLAACDKPCVVAADRRLVGWIREVRRRGKA